MLSDKEQLRDISSIGLKTVIGELPPASSGKQECFFLLFPFYKWKCFSFNFFFLLVTEREREREREMYLPLKDLCKYPFEQWGEKSLESYFCLKINSVILIEFKYFFGMPVLNIFDVGTWFYVIACTVTCRKESNQCMQWKKRYPKPWVILISFPFSVLILLCIRIYGVKLNTIKIAMKDFSLLVSLIQAEPFITTYNFKKFKTVTVNEFVK